MGSIRSHRDLDVYQAAFSSAMDLFDLSKRFPREERYSLTDQVRRSSRSVCSNVAEGFRKRIYEKAFVVKINDAESEAAETQCWIEFAQACGYLPSEVAEPLHREYDSIMARLVHMRTHAGSWTIGR